MRRVAVVGMGIRSPLGNSVEEVAVSLREGRSGIEFVPERKEMGFRSSLAGTLKGSVPVDVPKRFLNQMGLAARQILPATLEAIGSAGLSESDVQSERTGVIVGASGSMHDVYENCATFVAGKKLGGNSLQRVLTSSPSANLSVYLKTRGCCFSVCNACASGATAIGMSYQAIRSGSQDRMICGGVQEASWEYDCNFDALRAFSAREEAPTTASRPFDRDRDGLVPAAGASIVLLEELESAQRRGAPIVAEVVGFASNSDGYDMVAPSGIGAKRCMELALDNAQLEASSVDYINAHATSTRMGDIKEAQAIAQVFGEGPYVSSTKSMSGHELAAAGSSELIYTLIMMSHSFLAPTINLDNVDLECRGVRIVANEAIDADVNLALSSSFGFGGVNACLILKKTNG